MREQHVQPTSEQMSHEHFASTNRSNFASVNGGRPANPAVSHPMTNAGMVNHAAYNNNSRPAYNANNGSRPAYNNANNGYRAPANNEPHANTSAPHNSEPPHQGGGGQPHNEPHGGGEHEPR